jgi:hypothetical protein
MHVSYVDLLRLGHFATYMLFELGCKIAQIFLEKPDTVVIEPVSENLFSNAQPVRSAAARNSLGVVESFSMIASLSAIAVARYQGGYDMGCMVCGHGGGQGRRLDFE